MFVWVCVITVSFYREYSSTIAPAVSQVFWHQRFTRRYAIDSQKHTNTYTVTRPVNTINWTQPKSTNPKSGFRGSWNPGFKFVTAKMTVFPRAPRLLKPSFSLLTMGLTRQSYYNIFYLLFARQGTTRTTTATTYSTYICENLLLCTY